MGGEKKNQSELESKVVEIFSTIFDLGGSSDATQFKAAGSEKWDSLNHIHLITALEQEFGVLFSEDEVEQMDSFEVVFGLLKEKLGKGN